MNSETDRNLLFGLLALQNDFISRAALVGAFGVWTADKGRALGSILVEQGDLVESRRAVLEALVDEHVAQHGDDPARSLAALTSADGKAARALGELAGADLHAVLAATMTRRSSADETADLGAWVSPPPMGAASSADTRFVVLRPHARGGLGP